MSRHHRCIGHTLLIDITVAPSVGLYQQHDFLLLGIAAASVICRHLLFPLIDINAASVKLVSRLPVNRRNRYISIAISCYLASLLCDRYIAIPNSGYPTFALYKQYITITASGYSATLMLLQRNINFPTADFPIFQHGCYLVNINLHRHSGRRLSGWKWYNCLTLRYSLMLRQDVNRRNLLTLTYTGLSICGGQVWTASQTL